MKVHTKVMVPVMVTIENNWEDSASVRQIHNDAERAARNVLEAIFRNEPRARISGPLGVESVLVKDSAT